MPSQNLCTLSRGYKRKTKGFIISSENSNSNDIGDEPMQIKNKYKKINVAVCEDRVQGVKSIINKLPKTNTIVLDDAYQHRAINPGLKILITDFNNPFYSDFLLPAGRLRESRKGYRRADIIIVSKTPKPTTEKTLKNIKQKINTLPNQKLYFTSITYGNLNPFTSSSKKIDITNTTKASVLMLTGIANPSPLFSYVKSLSNNVEKITFPDHHHFNLTDIKKIKTQFNSINSNNKIIITTEKDIMRLSLPQIFNEIQDLPIFYIPIEIGFIDEQSKQRFDKQILEYVSSNTGN